jgi:hypothetical protein
MDTAYLYILAAAGAGVVLGLLLSLKVLGILLGGIAGALLIGFLGAAVFHWGNGTWYFGLALMVVPLYGGAVFGGAALSSELAKALRRRRGSTPTSGRS